MSNSYLFWKTDQDIVVEVDFTSKLASGETVTAVTVQPVSPVTSPPLTATLTDPSPTSDSHVLLSGGVTGLAYGFMLQVTTNARQLTVQCAVTVQSTQTFNQYTTSNPEAYQDLVDELAAGSAAQATSFFSFPPELDPRGGFVTWELLAQDGTTYSAGNAFSYEVKTTGMVNRVKAQAVITAPSDMPPTLLGQSYQIRWTLQLPQSVGLPGDQTANGTWNGQTTFFQFENVRIVGLNTVPMGVQPTSEIQGGPAHLQIGLDQLYDNVTVELWYSGTKVIAATPIGDPQRTSDGWLFEAVVDTTGLTVSVVPYTVIWRYWSSTKASMQYQETTELFVTNPSIMSAVVDIRAKIQKAGTTLYGTPDLLFPDPTVLLWLRRGMDYFNSAYGQFTSFTMTNAQGPVREYWLLCAEKSALEAQYLAEGEKAFNFQGQAISLDVDRTQYIDNAISKIQSQLDNELKSIKQNLIIKGNTSGDGSTDVSKLQVGAIGAVGLSLTAASMWGRGYPYGSGLR